MRVCFYTETQTFENKYWTGKKKGTEIQKVKKYGTKRKSDFGKTWSES